MTMFDISPLKPIEIRYLDLDTNEFISRDDINKRYGDGRRWWRMTLPNWENYQHLLVYKHDYFEKPEVMTFLRSLWNNHA